MRKRLPGMFISTTSGSTAAIPAHDGWIPVTDQNRARGSFEVRAIFGGGTTSVNLGIETATDPRNPDGSPTAICTAKSSNGPQDPESTPTTLSMLGKQMFRYVWLLTSSSGVGGCWVGGYGDAYHD